MNPLVDEFIKHCFLNQNTLNSTIHCQDEMLWFLRQDQTYQNQPEQATLAYFKSAQEIVDRLDQVITWKFKDWRNIDSFLEFACGYGRLTRFWVDKIGGDRLWVSDIYREAVDFVTQTWKVQGLYSAVNPEEYLCEQQFNCIIVYSLFSHLPEKRFYEWLHKLYELLLPDGLLLFSVHDQAVKPPGYDLPDSGILFIQQSESQSLDLTEYGSSWVTEAFVKKAIASASDHQASSIRIPRAFSLQDLYIVVKNPTQSFADLQVNFTPKGLLETHTMDDQGRLFLTGWAAVMQPQHSIKEVQIWLKESTNSNRHLIQRCFPTAPSESASQVLKINPQWTQKATWHCALSLPPGFNIETGLLLIKVISDRHKERIIYLNWIKPLLPPILPIPKPSPQSWKSQIISQLNWWKAKMLDNLKCGNIQAHLDRVTVHKNPHHSGCDIQLEGWALSLDTEITIIDIQIYYNGTLVQRCLPSCFRPDVAQYWGSFDYLCSGWIAQYYLPEPMQPSADRLQIKIIDSHNYHHLLDEQLLPTITEHNP